MGIHDLEWFYHRASGLVQWRKWGALHLRHTHAVHLLEAGANIKYVSERLGHASIVVTANTYLHITEKLEDDALQLYEKYVK